MQYVVIIFLTLCGDTKMNEHNEGVKVKTQVVEIASIEGKISHLKYTRVVNMSMKRAQSEDNPNISSHDKAAAR